MHPNLPSLQPMSPKPSFLRPITLVVIAFLVAASAHAQSFYIVSKNQYFFQKGPTTVIADSTAPFQFWATAPVAGITVTTPRGERFNLVFDAEDENYQIARSFVTKAALDAEFPDGTYTFSGPTLPTLTVVLGGDAYPNAPQISGGTWNTGGALLLSPTGSTTLNLNTFSGYATAGALGHVYAEFYPRNQETISKAVAGLDLPVSAQPLTSLVLPNTTLTNNFSYIGNIEFDTFTTVDTTSLPGSIVLAQYHSGTYYVAAALASGTGGNPAVFTQQPVSQAVALGANATFTVAVTTGTAPGQGAFFDWRHNGEGVNAGTKYTIASNGSLTVKNITAADAGNYSVRVGNTGGGVSSNVAVLTVNAVTAQPASQTAAAGQAVTLTTTTAAGATLGLQWAKNGAIVAGATSAALTLSNLQPSDAGIYALNVSDSGLTVASDPAIVGVSTTSKVIGTGTELLPVNIPHPNGNIFDQVLLTGAAETITADSTQITRTSYVDMNGDIVQVEFTGAGTLSLVLDTPTGPAAPVNYNQPGVSYMKGNAGIVITGANETTNVTIFTVGRATAFDPTGAFNILQPVSATNNPTNNGSSLFVGHADTVYDGVADFAFIAISTTNGKFGGLRASNASCFATTGLTGIYAPGVQFLGPVFIGDINASDAATPVFMIGSSPDTRITGGDLFQTNGQPVRVSGLTQLKFTDGGTSNNTLLPAQTNKALLQQAGVDMTAQIVVSP